MKPHITLITLGVLDLDRAIEFYEKRETIIDDHSPQHNNIYQKYNSSIKEQHK